MPRDISRLDVYCRARELVPVVYAIADALGPLEVHGIAPQLRRAVVSISSNIAEGANRGSPSDYHRFLGIALGSASEVLSLLEVVRENALAPHATLEHGQRASSVVIHGLRKLRSAVDRWPAPRPANKRARHSR